MFLIGGWLLYNIVVFFLIAWEKSLFFYWVLGVSNSIYLLTMRYCLRYYSFTCRELEAKKFKYSVQCSLWYMWWSLYWTGWISQNPGLSIAYTNSLNACGSLTLLCYLHILLSQYTVLRYMFSGSIISINFTVSWNPFLNSKITQKPPNMPLNTFVNICCNTNYILDRNTEPFCFVLFYIMQAS